MIFFESIHCRSRLRCRICRDREGGRKQRGQWPYIPEEVDFECPHGLPWLTAETAARFAEALKLIPVSKIPPSLAARRIEAHCRTCEHFQDRRCLLYRDGHCSPCEFAAYLNRPNAICPAGQVVFA